MHCRQYLVLLASLVLSSYAFNGNHRVLRARPSLQASVWFSDPERIKDRSHVLAAPSIESALQQDSSRFILSCKGTVCAQSTADGETVRGLFFSCATSPAVWWNDELTEVAWIGQKSGRDFFVLDNSDWDDAEKLLANLGDACDDGQIFVRAPVREYGDRMVSSEEAALYATANGLALFHRSHPFCSKCGNPTVAAKAGGCRRCTSATCKTSVYPRIDSAAIMLVTSACGEFALLGRKRVWPTGRWSTLAGFAEVGETLEECVVREVFEEAGVCTDLSSVQFVASQPWPFPRSLMVGFVVKALAADSSKESPVLPSINVDTNELEDVQWFSREYVRQRLESATLPSSSDSGLVVDDPKFNIPGPASLARVLISTWAFESSE